MQRRAEKGGQGEGAPEPSSSLLLKQLSMMRRFSSSNRSARFMPPDDDITFASHALACWGSVDGVSCAKRATLEWQNSDRDRDVSRAVVESWDCRGLGWKA